jgi:ferredoxin
VSLRVIGVAAGLGELGHSKMLLTPEFGPRQRVFAVFTDAALEATPLFEGGLCDGCLSCARECEAGAIGPKRSVEFSVGGRTYAHAPFDPAACTAVHTGRDPRFSPFWTGAETPGQDPAYSKFLKDRFRHLSICVGRGCLRACLDHLEKTGRIKARFNRPLIERQRWKLNEAPPPRDAAEGKP